MTHSPTLSTPVSGVTDAEVSPVLPALVDIIDVLAATDPDTWWAGPTHRSPCGTQHCALSHVEKFWGMAGFEEFEDRYSTSYVIGATVNDGPSARYPQAHPKDRVLAYLCAMDAGDELTTQQSMEVEYQQYLIWEAEQDADSRVDPTP